MKIYYYKHRHGNVGDDLNAWLWQKIMPDLFQGYRYHGAGQDDEDTEPIFIGIGTLLNELVPARCNKAVFGTGTGYGNPVRHLNARYYAVRGPLTAARLDLSPDVSVTDGAALIATLERPKVNIQHKISIIPHHGSSEESARWESIAERLKINYINPSSKPEDVINTIVASELVVTEAMHGAILADTLRVPWIPYLTTRGRHEFKWEDWCASLKLNYEPARLHPLYKTINVSSAINNYIKQEINVLELKNIIKFKPRCLSNQKIFEEKVNLLKERMDEFKYDFAAGRFSNNGPVQPNV